MAIVINHFKARKDKKKDKDTVIYDGHDFPVEHFTVTVKEPGRYRILVHAEDFIGSYKFSYDMGQ